MMGRIKGRSFEHALTISEPGYVLLNWIALEAGWGIWFPNLVCATIFTVGLLTFCRQQPNPWLAVAVAIPYFVVVVGMGYTRQSAALGFELLALSYYTRGSFVKMGLSAVLAVTFHTSALVVLPILGLALARRGVGTFLLVGALAVVLGFAFSGRVQGLVSVYTSGVIVSSGAVPRLLMNVIPALLFLSFPRRLTFSEAERRLWSIFSILCLLSILVLFYVSSSVVVDRLGLYLIPLQIVVWSRLPSAFATGSRQSMFMMGLILFYSVTVEVVWLTFGTWGHAWLPYRNYAWESATSRTPPRWFRQTH